MWKFRPMGATSCLGAGDSGGKALLIEGLRHIVPFENFSSYDRIKVIPVYAIAGAVSW